MVDRVGGVKADIDVDVKLPSAGVSKVVLPKGPDGNSTGTRLSRSSTIARRAKTSWPRCRESRRSCWACWRSCPRVVLRSPPWNPHSAMVPRSLTAPLSRGLLLALARSSRREPRHRDRAGAGPWIRCESDVPGRGRGGDALVGYVERFGPARPSGQGQSRTDYGWDGPGSIGPTIRTRISPAGFTVTDTRKEPSQTRTKTIIEIFDTTSQSMVRASQLASAIRAAKGVSTHSRAHAEHRRPHLAPGE